MTIKNVSGKALKYLAYCKECDWVDNDYKIIATHEVKKPLPIYTDVFNRGGGYLAGFQDYYTKCWNGWALKEDYREANRPRYTVEVTYNLYDIELTEQGRKKVVARYEQHLRCAERYASLLPTND